MLDQRIKDILSEISRPLFWANGALFKLRFKTSSKPVYLNVGCGHRKMTGFLNIDHNYFSKPDLCLDIRNKLPFPDSSVDGIYFGHVLEHIRHDDAIVLCREYLRILKPGAGIRIVTPSVSKAIEAYARGDRDWFSDFPEKRVSLGGRFANYLLCAGQHVDMYDGSWMTELLEGVGFVRVKEVRPADTSIFPSDVFSQLTREKEESATGHRSLFVEAFKP